MRIINALWVAVLIVAFAVPAIAKNDVVVQGDLLRDGFLTINVDWKVDTRKYKGVPKGEIRGHVRNEMYKKIQTKLAKKTGGLAVSYDKSNFTKLSENVKLVQKRKDGSRVFDIDITVQFDAPCHTATAGQTTTPKKQTQDQNSLLLRSWNNTY